MACGHAAARDRGPRAPGRDVRRLPACRPPRLDLGARRERRERGLRELRLLRIYEGTDEIQRRTIARNLIKGHTSVSGALG